MAERIRARDVGVRGDSPGPLLDRAAALDQKADALAEEAEALREEANAADAEANRLGAEADELRERVARGDWSTEELAEIELATIRRDKRQGVMCFA